MPEETIENKLALYHEFFAIEHDFSVNVKAVECSNNLTFEYFLSTMPMPFKLVTEISAIDQSALQSFKNVGNNASVLVNLFNQQSQKIDLLIGYILSQQDEEKKRFKGVKFGGGGINFIALSAMEVGKILELKIFLLENNCAIYCYGEVISIEECKEHEQRQYIHQVIFHFIREEDRETLVRASLHEQSKQLQKLAKLRNQEANNKI